MTRPVVLIAEELSPATVEVLGPDVEVRSVDGTDRAALLAAVKEADALLVRSATQVDAEVYAAADHLKVVARAGVGLDNVDVAVGTTVGRTAPYGEAGRISHPDPRSRMADTGLRCPLKPVAPEGVSDDRHPYRRRFRDASCRAHR